jgi:hypothetical protein
MQMKNTKGVIFLELNDGNVQESLSEKVASNSFGQLQIPIHDRHSLCVDGAQIGVLEQRNQVRLSCFLKGQHSLTLKPDFTFELGGYLSDKSLEG